MVQETVVGRLQWEKVGAGHSRLVQQVPSLCFFALRIVWAPPPQQVGSSMKPLNGFLILLGRNPSSLKWAYPDTSSLIFHPHYTANLVNPGPTPGECLCGFFAITAPFLPASTSRRPRALFPSPGMLFLPPVCQAKPLLIFPVLSIFS